MIANIPSTERLRRALAGLAMPMLVLGWIAGSPEARAASADEVPVLLPVQEKVLYLPVPGDSPSIQQIREKEVQAIQRFMRAQNLAQEPIVTPVRAPEVYLQVEPALAMEARNTACKGLEDATPL